MKGSSCRHVGGLRDSCGLRKSPIQHRSTNSTSPVVAILRTMDLALFTAPPMGSRLWNIRTAVTPRLRRSGRYLLRKVTSFGGPEQRYLGHPAVTRSLLAGLDELGVEYSYNRNAPESSRWGILSDTSTLRWAEAEIDRRFSQSRSPVIVAGPTLTDDFVSIRSELMQDHVRYLVVPCEWKARVVGQAIPQIAGKVRIWIAGVDQYYWIPAGPHSPRNRFLIYVKDPLRSQSELSLVHSMLKRRGLGVCVLRYGSYTREQYRTHLALSSGVIWLGGKETQCLAQFEAWSMNKPTFVRAVSESESGSSPLSELEGNTHMAIHSDLAYESPHLSEMTGARWESLEELSDLIADFRDTRFAPRDWILANATDEIAARAYLDLHE